MERARECRRSCGGRVHFRRDGGLMGEAADGLSPPRIAGSIAVVAFLLLFFAPRARGAQSELAPGATQTGASITALPDDRTPPLEIRLPPEDDLDVFLGYYHLQPQPERAVLSLKLLLGSPRVSSPQARQELAHFFAAIALFDRRVRDSLTRALDTAGPEQREFIDRILVEADDFKSLPLDKLESFPLLWAEYRATGSEVILGRFLDALDRATRAGDSPLADAIRRSLLENAKKWGGLRFLREKNSEIGGAEVLGLDELMADINKAGNAAEILAGTGENLAKVRKYDDAFAAFQEALHILPYAPPTLVALGKAFALSGNRSRGLFLLEHAARLAPTQGWYQATLAQAYEQDGRPEQAIMHYQKAVELDPLNPFYQYHYGRVCPGTECTTEHFLRYLELAPDGPFSPFVRQFLAGAGVSLPPRPETGPELLHSRQFDKLEKHLAAFAKAKDADGESLLAQEFRAITRDPVDRGRPEASLDLLREWVERQPESHFASAILGSFLVDYAWEARGEGYAQTVTAKGTDLFRERLTEASRYLEKAYELGPGDPLVPAALIAVAKGLGLRRDEVERQFQRALMADDRLIDAYREKLAYLMAKWHGSDAEMFEFARWCAEHAPAGSNVSSILNAAHWEAYFSLRREDPAAAYFKDLRVWGEMKPNYQQLMGAFPNSVRMRNWFAMAAYLAGDLETVREQLEILGAKWFPAVWGDLVEYQRVRREVGLPPLPDGDAVR